MMCGGRLYSIEPGVLVRIRGQNLAVVDKYWIDKLRCALCSYLVLADVPALARSVTVCDLSFGHHASLPSENRF